MSIAFQFSIDGMEDVRAVFERFSKIGRSPRRSLGRTGLFIIREAARIIRSSAHTWGPGTGKLAKSLTMRLDEASVVVGSNLRYAAVQHEGTAGLPGGAITPKGHKYLAIPVLAHLRKGGVWPRDLPHGSMRFLPAAKIRIGSHSWIGPALVRVGTDVSSAEGAARSRYRQNRNTRGQFVKGGSRDAASAGPAQEAEDQVMYALVRRVRIRGMHYLILPWQRHGRAFLINEMMREYRQAVVRGRGA